MNPSRQTNHDAAYFRRKVPTKTPKKAILIVTEGAKTEPLYLKALEERLELRTSRIEVLVDPGGADPITITERAIKLKNERKKAVRKSGFLVVFDEVWVVFDLEGPHHPHRQKSVSAKDKAKSHGINCAISDPAFEYWLLLHEDPTHRPFVNCDEVIIHLKKYWPAYEKAQSPSSEFLDKIPTAVINSERCRKHHEACGGDENPSTTMDLLVRSLNDNANDDLKFPL